MPSKMSRRIAAIFFLALSCLLSAAQVPSVRWSVSARKAGADSVVLTFSGKIGKGQHIYPPSHPVNPTEVTYAEGVTILTPLSCNTPSTSFKGEDVLFSNAEFSQTVSAPSGSVEGTVSWQACREEECGMVEDWDFKATVPVTIEQAPPVETPRESAGSIWALILEAILWGFAMLLTPCVFPMVPMTVSFFLKGSSTPAAGRFKAFMYGIFIVLLYTVPISLIILITRILGGETVTADIFNWLATHWLPNLIFFIVFMVFAASFFGAFEITLPSSWTNGADRKSDRKGLAGVFFMALTLVLVSFSCTGPIVGTVLIKSTAGEFWAPMATMLAFSAAFALPFTILALFPSLLKKLKSGSWLGSVKIVLGFIEVALGLKFLSVADQTYHWGILDREVYLAIWIAVFTLLGLYLIGVLRFKDEGPFKGVGVFRLTLAIIDLAFVAYLIPGMFGAPLKALSGYLPPLETQDFILGQEQPSAPAATVSYSSGPDLALAHGLRGYSTIEAALEASRASGKPVFVDITGHGCVNCREMEARVWSNPEVLPLLRDSLVILALYTDDKTRLPESRWITGENGKVLKDVGRVNSYIARTRFGVNAQPNYTILDADGNQKVPVRGYNLDAADFARFLRDGIR
ncbi:MAG: thioredoxin family protein [Bacteroidales bacterium]|nr:thioredoxin family protein [Bacteroidales bacterium]